MPDKVEAKAYAVCTLFHPPRKVWVESVQMEDKTATIKDGKWKRRVVWLKDLQPTRGTQ